MPAQASLSIPIWLLLTISKLLKLHRPVHYKKCRFWVVSLIIFNWSCFVASWLMIWRCELSTEIYLCGPAWSPREDLLDGPCCKGARKSLLFELLLHQEHFSDFHSNRKFLSADENRFLENWNLVCHWGRICGSGRDRWLPLACSEHDNQSSSSV